MPSVRATAAGLGKRLLGERYWAVRLRLLKKPERARIAEDFAKRHGAVVQRGPFKGMRFHKRVSGQTTLAPMLYGSYEEELYPVIEEAIDRKPPVVVDIGCAEGYYAVGLALRLPTSRVIAFDTDPAARYLCRRAARLNNVQVEVLGECDPGYLATLPPGSFVLSDCEGAEKELIRPVQGVSFTVEVHDHIDPTIADTLKARFADHPIEEIWTRERNYPGVDPRVLSEERAGPMRWLVIAPAST